MRVCGTETVSPSLRHRINKAFGLVRRPSWVINRQLGYSHVLKTTIAAAILALATPASAEPWFQLDACLGVQISHSMSDGI